MTSLSHEQAREFIQQEQLADEDRLALRQHLADCEECRAYAAIHVHLWQQLPLRTPRATPSYAQRQAILDAAERQGMPRFWRPMSAAAGLAVLVFLVLSVWVVAGATRRTASQPDLPAPLATMLAPFLPQPTPTIEPTPDPAGRYVIDTVPAPSLAGNIIGEPLEQQVAVYLPPSYDGSDRRYPVVYALTNDFMVDTAQVVKHAGDTRFGMKLALGEGAQEMIVVTPDFLNALNLTNLFVNSPISGDWERYIAVDLVNYIDANYRTLPATESRGLLGATQNGMSAFGIAMRHADVFGSVYLQRPIAFHPDGLEQTNMLSPAGRIGVLNLFEELSALPEEERLSGMKAHFAPGNTYPFSQFGAIIYGIAFAPAAEAGPPYFEYPYTAPDGQIDPDIWRKWESGYGEIPQKIEAYRDVLLALNIAVSSEDAPGSGATFLSEQLTTAGISHAFAQSETSALEELGRVVFPFFSEVLTFE